MKWGPTLLVLAVLGFLFWIARSRPATTNDGRAPAPVASQHAPEKAHGETPSASSESAHAPAANPASDHSAAAPAQAAAKPVVAAAPDLPPPPRAPNSVVGFTRESTGAGASQLVVTLRDANGKESTTRSGVDGRFVFENVAPGACTIDAFDPDYLYTVHEKTTVTAKSGATTDAVVRVDRGAGVVKGLLLDGDKKPVADHAVTFSVAGGREQSVATDSKGRFLLSGLMAGDWKVVPAGFPAAARNVRVEAGAPADVTFVLQRKASVALLLTGSHLHRAEFTGKERVLLRPKAEGASALEQPLAVHGGESEDGHEASHEEPTGHASFTGLEPGDYELDVVDELGKKSLLGSPLPLTLRDGEERLLTPLTADAARGTGIEVATWVRVVMFAAIGLMIFVTPVIFPPPVVPQRPAGRAAQPAGH
jgi:hypothetical protein